MGMNEQELISDEEPENDEPPVLGSWKNFYTVVLVLHLMLLIAFYLFSRAYTV